MSRVERSAPSADPILDALVQAALDHGAPEETICAGSSELTPGAAVYCLRFQSRSDGFNPVIEAGDAILEAVGFIVEDGIATITFRVA